MSNSAPTGMYFQSPWMERLAAVGMGVAGLGYYTGSVELGWALATAGGSALVGAIGAYVRGCAPVAAAPVIANVEGDEGPLLHQDDLPAVRVPVIEDAEDDHGPPPARAPVQPEAPKDGQPLLLTHVPWDELVQAAKLAALERTEEEAKAKAEALRKEEAEAEALRKEEAEAEALRKAEATAARLAQAAQLKEAKAARIAQEDEQRRQKEEAKKARLAQEDEQRRQKEEARAARAAEQAEQQRRNQEARAQRDAQIEAERIAAERVEAERVAAESAARRAAMAARLQPKTYTISGQVLLNGQPVTGATVKLSGESQSTTTSTVNGYEFAGLPEGGRYQVAVKLGGHDVTQSGTVEAGLWQNQTRDFIATPVVATKSPQTIDVTATPDEILEAWCDRNGRYRPTRLNVYAGGCEYEFGDSGVYVHLHPNYAGYADQGHVKPGDLRHATGTILTGRAPKLDADQLRRYRVPLGGPRIPGEIDSDDSDSGPGP